MKRVNFVILFIVMLLVIPFIVMAQEAAKPTMGTVFQDWFVDYVAPILAAIILALLSLLLKKLLSIFGIKLSANNEAVIMGYAEKLVRGAEEMAAQKVKETGDKISFTGADKMAYVLDALSKKFPKLTSDEINKIAYAAVNKIPGIGLSGNTESTGAK